MRGLALLGLAFLLAACGPAPPFRQEAYVFGTRVEVLVQGVPDDQARQATAAVLREFDRLHRAYHAWQPSELSALNQAIAAGRRHEVSPELAAYLRESQALAAAGEYLFDPGLGRLVALWGFHGDEIATAPPDAAALQRLRAQRPSIAALHIEGDTVRSDNPAVAIDFGGYLKGVALDRAAALLRERGVRNALINIGGNVMALGSKGGDKGGVPWRVGIQHPRPETVGGAALASLDLRDGEAIGTSGDYHRYFEAGGRRYPHLLDPRSGEPARGTQAVTLLVGPGDKAGMRSDALSKPVFIAGEQWRTMARRLDLPAVLKVGADGTVEATPAMKARLTVEARGVTWKEVP